MALLVRDRLAADGLDCVPGDQRVEGHAPVRRARRQAHHEEVRDYAKGIAEELESEQPELVVSQMTKARRGGKVFLDWSQNTGAKTTISPYSLRGREFPTVAAPRTWDEVEAGAEDPLASSTCGSRRSSSATSDLHTARPALRISARDDYVHSRLPGRHLSARCGAARHPWPVRWGNTCEEALDRRGPGGRGAGRHRAGDRSAVRDRRTRDRQAAPRARLQGRGGPWRGHLSRAEDGQRQGRDPSGDHTTAQRPHAHPAARRLQPHRRQSGGRTVAIVDAYGYPNLERDLGIYRAQFGLPACTTANGCLRIIDQNGGTSLPRLNVGWAQEQALDVDAVSAACPDCKIVVVQAKSAPRRRPRHRRQHRGEAGRASWRSPTATAAATRRTRPTASTTTTPASR